MDVDLSSPLVLDNGSSSCRIGFAGDDKPSEEFTCVLGKPKETKFLLEIGLKEEFIGDEAESKRGILKFEYPMEHSIVKNWDSMQKIWFHAFFEQLCCNPCDHPVLLTDIPMNPKSNREKMAELMFEFFDAPAINISNQSFLSFFSSGITTGVLLDCGHGVTNVVPFYEGNPLKEAIFSMNIAGNELDYYLLKLQNENFFNTNSGLEIVKDMKEKMCFVSQNYEEELINSETSNFTEKFYELPDGNKIKLGNERFKCPEGLFQPQFMGMEEKGVHEMILSSIQKCDIDLKKEMYSNVVLSGASTLFEGFKDRLNHELTKLSLSSISVNIIAPKERKHSAWRGGSKICSLNSFHKFWILKKEYEENGPTIIHSKCN
jgi:actin-related protein